MIRIGIDPDVQASGIAVMMDHRLSSLENLTFFDLMDYIDRMKEHFGSNVIYSVEHVEWTKKVWTRPKCKQNEMKEIARNVGLVHYAGRLIVEKLTLSDCKFELIKPLKGTIKKAKKDAKFFNRIMKWDLSLIHI